MPNHTESELKFKAPPSLTTEQFVAWGMENACHKVEHVGGWDYYFKQGPNVIRYRESGEHGGELTVKRRYSNKATTHRLEVDLLLGSKVGPEDVKVFLAASGWKEALSLFKNSVIIDIAKMGVVSTLALYEVTAQGKKARSFLEVETEKGLDQDTASQVLDLWKSKLSKELGVVSKPLNKSLWEIYSGEQYRLWTPKTKL